MVDHGVVAADVRTFSPSSCAIGRWWVFIDKLKQIISHIFYSRGGANGPPLAQRCVSLHTPQAGRDTKCKSGKERDTDDWRRHVDADDSCRPGVHGRRGDQAVVRRFSALWAGQGTVELLIHCTYMSLVWNLTARAIPVDLCRGQTGVWLGQLGHCLLDWRKG